MQIFSDFFTGLFTDKFVAGGLSTVILQGLWTTVMVAALSVIIGTLLGLLLCYLKRSRFTVLRIIYGVYDTIITGVPIVITLIVVYSTLYVSGVISTLLLSIAVFSLYFALEVVQLLSNGISTVNQGQYQAAEALGYTRASGFMKIILPQALHKALPDYRHQIIALFKLTTVAGLISISELTRSMLSITSFFTQYKEYIADQSLLYYLLTALIYFAIVWIAILLMKLVEKWLVPGYAKKEARR